MVVLRVHGPYRLWTRKHSTSREEYMTGRGKLALLAGIIIAGASPSFVDWEQSPEYRHQIIAWYGAATVLIVFGLWDGGS
jgi:hypothetical protein